MAGTHRGAPAQAPTQDSAATRELLEEQWRGRVNEISELTVQLYDARAAAGLADGDSSVAEMQVLEEQVAVAGRALADLEAALQRLADGGYGVCEECGHPIAPERLEVLPEATLCAPCQGRAARSRR